METNYTPFSAFLECDERLPDTPTHPNVRVLWLGKDVGNSVSAVAFFQGRLYAADYSKKCLWYFDADSSGSPDMTKPHIIAEGTGADFVDLVRLCI